MDIIASILIDKHGHIKYVPQYFKPNECDVCVSNYLMKNIGNKTLYYTPLQLEDGFEIDTCWTVREVIRRCTESNANKIKIFVGIQDFYNEITELQFAYIDELDSWDEEIDMDRLKQFCNSAKREFLGEIKNIKFFRYTIDKQ